MSWWRTLWLAEQHSRPYTRFEDSSDNEMSSGLLAAEKETEKSFRLTLTQTSEYASSELYRDNFEIQKRISHTSEHKRDGLLTKRCDNNSIRPKIRLETLSSTLATTIVWIAYIAFAFALLSPYLQSEGYLSETTAFSGDLCSEPFAWRSDQNGIPCTRIDTKRDVAVWSAKLHDVLRFGGGISLNIRTDQVKLLASRPTLLSHTDFLRLKNAFVLDFEWSLYELSDDNSTIKKQIAFESNQTAWISCLPESGCEEAKLIELPQHSVYNSLISSKYAFMEDIRTSLAAGKASFEFSELLMRAILLVFTSIALPCWLISVLRFSGSWWALLSAQKWTLFLGVVLLFWQNPISLIIDSGYSTNPRLRQSVACCQAFAESFFYVGWLQLVDLQSRMRVQKFSFGISLFIITLCMALFGLNSSTTVLQACEIVYKTLFVMLGFIRLTMLLYWVFWAVQLSWKTASYLKSVPYMSTRYQQLSYRFLILESILILSYVLVMTTFRYWSLLQVWYLIGYEAFLQNAIETFLELDVGQSSLGQFIFLSIYVYLLLYVHLPPSCQQNGTKTRTTSIKIREESQFGSLSMTRPDSFCIETALWLLELAWQAYFDSPGQPSESGYGEINLEPYGFELIAQLRNAVMDTHVLIAYNATKNRLVVAFRGTSSRQNWKSNLRFHQTVLWIKSQRANRNDGCRRRLKRILSKIPLFDMALPRVHSGFWQAYMTVRSDLKRVVRLLLYEHPGVSTYVTGHSMGGTLAILAAYDFSVSFDIAVEMYNFGGPRVGNPSFVRNYNRHVPNSYRVVMDGDIVPGVPKFWGLYQHIGTEVALDLEGNLIVGPSFIEKKLQVGSKHKLATHPSRVYRSALALCFDKLVAENP
ncbi:unnamed protein product [Albugo candida]|uniref:Fungal lipase-type domain-containing protein n=2 Tax=Albugo candida TaxID=65357 RepID=A0A024G132_9STRA|nr:unnamed protein product [Albugo candida]|eukprot:CCI40557.1 unnamed protein product [Albugo candida]